MRAFISVNLSDSLYPGIERLQQELTPANRGIRWTPPANCHFTLKFLGEVPPATVPIIDRALQPISQEFGPFTLEFCGLGQFPPKGPASVVWIGASKGAAILSALEEQIRLSLKEANVSFDHQKFVPHLTIGRARRNEKVFVKGLHDYKDTVCGSFRVESFYLMESVLSPGGSVYTPKISFVLSEPGKVEAVGS